MRRGSAGSGGDDGSGGGNKNAERAAVGALVLAVLALIIVITLGGGNSYTVSAVFEDAGGLVTGDNVLIGPTVAGTVSSIGLSRNGQAIVTMSLHSDIGQLHQGTEARIYEDSLSGIASKYVTLIPGPSTNAPIPDGGVIGPQFTQSPVNLDQLFDAFDPATRIGLQNLIRGEAQSLYGKGLAANAALKYLAPGLQSTSAVTAELTRSEPEFDALLVQGARALGTLATRSEELSQLIANTSTATGAIARQSQALEEALTLLPTTLTRSTVAFRGLNKTLDALDPLVAASKPAVRNLPFFLSKLNPLLTEAVPTIGLLADLVHNPAGTGDLTQLAQTTPQLERVGAKTFPLLVQQFNDSQSQLDYLREFTPDVMGALTNLGQAAAYYDANGHYVRTQPSLFPFAIDSSHELTTQPPSQRYNGLQAVRNRCPGSAMQPSPDGSAPWLIPGCALSSVPPGP